MGERQGTVRRGGAALLAIVVMALATISFTVVTPAPAYAAPAVPGPSGQCSTEEWAVDIPGCVKRLTKVADIECRKPPTPGAPDSGLAGWFAERPASSTKPGPQGIYSQYGYAGYSYTTYLEGCTSSLIDPEFRFETTVANGEFMIATAIIGASNALRERAWDPETLWGWADPLVDQATKAVYTKVFSVFGVLTLCVVGLYLIWRSRQADMGSATTTAGWAVLVMVAVTAIAAWPVRSANIADATLVNTLAVVHDAVGPRAQDTPDGCKLTPDSCKDVRPPAVRASDTATDTMLYRNWVRGILGSADSETAMKYGRALYDARSLSWDDAQRLRDNPNSREPTLKNKQVQWATIANQIKSEDPEAYDYLQGINGMDRVGSGFIAMLAALMFAMFDLTASLLVLLGFLIFRWAVIAAPILGTVGLLQPASAGLRRLGNAVVAAVFNIAIFGTGAAIYLFAVDLIMHTASLPGWLQVVLVWLCGVVGWLLLRPYRRITQLGGKDGAGEVASAGSWHRRFFRDMREAAKLDIAEPGTTREPLLGSGRRAITEQGNLRPESRHEDPAHSAASRTGTAAAVVATRGSPPIRAESSSAPRGSATSAQRPEGVEAAENDAARRGSTRGHPPATAGRRRESSWSEPDVPDNPTSYAIYRPETRKTDREQSTPRKRTEAR